MTIPEFPALSGGFFLFFMVTFALLFVGTGLYAVVQYNNSSKGKHLRALPLLIVPLLGVASAFALHHNSTSAIDAWERGVASDLKTNYGVTVDSEDISLFTRNTGESFLGVTNDGDTKLLRFVGNPSRVLEVIDSEGKLLPHI